jgi:hypothetical protein
MFARFIIIHININVYSRLAVDMVRVLGEHDAAVGPGLWQSSIYNISLPIRHHDCSNVPTYAGVFSVCPAERCAVLTAQQENYDVNSLLDTPASAPAYRLKVNVKVPGFKIQSRYPRWVDKKSRLISISR